MYPTSNVNGQQSAGQPIYYPANSSQPAYSQGYVNSQVGNQQAPQHVNNVRVQQVSDQPLYDPPVYSQSALNQHSQGYVNYSQPCLCQCSVGRPQLTYNGGVVNQVIRQPMMGSVSRAQYTPAYQFAPANLTALANLSAPVYNGQSARTQPISANLRAQHLPTVSLPSEVLRKELVVDPCSEKKEEPSSVVVKKPTLEELPVKTQEFLKAMDKCLQNKASSSSSSDAQNTSPLAQIEKEQTTELFGMDAASIQQHLEQQKIMQKKILDLLQPEPLDYSWKPTKPKSYTMALERFKAFKPEETIAQDVARKNASMVFIYDIDDITQLSLDILRGVRRMFPDLKKVTKAVEEVFYFMGRKFFEYSEDYDYDATSMNVRDGYFGAKVNEYVEFKNKLETNGSNVFYELIKAYEEALKQQQEAMKIKTVPRQNVELDQVEEFQKMFDQLWQSSKKCLQAISDKSLKKTYENVVICDMIGYGSSRLLLAGLTSEVPLENLYSSRTAKKEAVLERIQRDYGDSCTFVVVTSNEKTIAAAKKKDILVWPVEDEKSFDALYTAQKSQLLK